MKVQLLVSTDSPLCQRAEQVWREVAAERDIDFSVLDLAQQQGSELAQALNLKTVPALVVDGVLIAIGVLSLEQALNIVDTVSQH